MRKIIEAGETLRLYINYNDVDTGVALDPASIVATIREPDGVEYDVTYPSVNFVREQTGSYFLRVQTTIAGTHAYSVLANFASGDIDVREGKFDSEPSL